MKRVEKILIANRGEIAVRVARTCRSMGIATVAVFSEADANALHVHVADEAVCIGPAPSVDSYLHVERILDAARRSGADALHPGYGFLSERAELAEACAEHGLTFIGPAPATIRAMGLKREAKALARAAGVPVVPGYDGTDPSRETLAEHAAQVGFPVLLKASAGGGGKGMRVCRSEEELSAAIDAARREALAAFGDDTLLLEKYIERPRHVEIQILGDRHGRVVHLFERECSIQRRYQKIIEESPSTALDEALRARMGEAAVALGEAMKYEGAGTVEFIVDPEDHFYFLEVNTRLQVEHPVTEQVTGLDLVREQIRIARGEPLGYARDALRQSGSALECRLYAEDPARGFLPGSGRLVDFHLPELPGVRLDSGVTAGSEVSIHYDPMLAKLITHGTDREEARLRMLRALEALSVHGVATNRELLLRTLRHPEYVAGRLHTHFVEQHAEALLDATPDESLRNEAAAALVIRQLRQRALCAPAPAVRSGFRNNYWRDQHVAFACASKPLSVRYRVLRDGSVHVEMGEWQAHVQVVEDADPRWVLQVDGVRRTYRVLGAGERHYVQVAGQAFELVEVPRFPSADEQLPEGACVAPMPGKVVQLEVAPDQRVEAGQRLLVMEAMKMEHVLTAASAGRVHLFVAEGQQVDADQMMAVVEPED